MMHLREASSWAGCAVFLIGCGIVPERVTLSDPRVAPMLKALEQVDRASLGFTPLQGNASVRLERSHGAYDAMLHIEGDTSRTIAFKKSASGYVWVHEQEIHRGPHDYTSPDGTFKESIAITFEKAPVSGAPLDRPFVTYSGDDPRFAGRVDLTLADVAPVLAQWRRSEQPSAAQQRDEADEVRDR